MAIIIDWYENPVAPNQPNKKRLHARPVCNGKTSTKELRHKIQQRCSLTHTDVTAVLSALSETIGEALSNGRRVHLDGIGYFYPTVECTEEIKPDTKRRTPKVKLKSVRFLADKDLKENIGNAKMERNQYSYNHSAGLSELEIDIRLTAFFATSDRMTRRQFQELCQMTRSTALNHLRRLRQEGKLQNAGLVHQPIYIPVPGYYGVSRH
ncbi:MAG: HU family DNA-binding protein [Prevotellaceae bacterium]|jgi:predicted histone-like DNA-binding protein|nr:HU family DNA-binding protein [Prevotellaceae bacterium]